MNEFDKMKWMRLGKESQLSLAVEQDKKIAELSAQVNELRTKLNDCNHCQYVRDENEMQQSFNECFERGRQSLARHYHTIRHLKTEDGE